MSRVIKIKSKIIIKSKELAKETIEECGVDIEIVNNQFNFNKYDAYDQIDKNQKAKEMQIVEKLYLEKYALYVAELEEKERQRVEEEKRVSREDKYNKIVENAKKQGYKVKKEKREDNTIKLVLQRRVY